MERKQEYGTHHRALSRLVELEMCEKFFNLFPLGDHGGWFMSRKFSAFMMISAVTGKAKRFSHASNDACHSQLNILMGYCRFN